MTAYFRVAHFLTWAVMLAMPVACAAGQTPTSDDTKSALTKLREIRTPNGISVAETVTIGGIKQAILIRGKDRDNPVLLFLHGGPGTPEMPLSSSYQEPLEEFFTVVQWDQRGAGKTYQMNPPDAVAPTISISRMVADTEELVAYLSKRLGKSQIVLVGHSWGTVLGTSVAMQRPDLVSAYVGVGQVVDTAENERLGYAWVTSEAARRKDAVAVKELSAVAPYPTEPINVRSIVTVRKYQRRYGALWLDPARDGSERLLRAISTDYSADDLEALKTGAGAQMTVRRLIPELSGWRSRTIGRSFKTPVVIFAGIGDHATSTALAKDYFDWLEAPTKRFVLFRNSAHMIQHEEPGRFVDAMVNVVRPLVVGGDAVAGAGASRP